MYWNILWKIIPILIIFGFIFYFQKKNSKIHSFSEYHTMLLPQRVKVCWSSAAIRLVHRCSHQQLPNTKTETGKMLETWLKLDMVMVQSPLVLSQWSLVVIQKRDIQIVVIQRECIIHCVYPNLIPVYFQYGYGTLGLRLSRKPNHQSYITKHLQFRYRLVSCWWEIL